MHPLMIEELAAERSRDLHEQARRARLGAAAGGSGRGRIARRLGLWFLSAGMRMAGRPGDRVIVEFAGGGSGGRRASRINRTGGSRRIRG